MAASGRTDGHSARHGRDNIWAESDVCGGRQHSDLRFLCVFFLKQKGEKKENQRRLRD
eukprot:m.70790 g.70790  ORF g.70790 m.70790 type:complete len:58 (-) comp16862_c0_seq3:35-208(-)